MLGVEDILVVVVHLDLTVAVRSEDVSTRNRSAYQCSHLRFTFAYDLTRYCAWLILKSGEIWWLGFENSLHWWCWLQWWDRYCSYVGSGYLVIDLPVIMTNLVGLDLTTWLWTIIQKINLPSVIHHVVLFWGEARFVLQKVLDVWTCQ